MADGEARLTTEIGALASVRSYLTGTYLSQMREKGWLTNDIVKVGRHRRISWTITDAGRAELAERLKIEQRIKEAA